MALLTCPECGNGVSEYADRCQTCGCPIDIVKKKNNKTKGGYCLINGKSCDLNNALTDIKNGNIVLAMRKIMDASGLDTAGAKNLADIIKSSGEIPHKYDRVITTTQQSINKITCPYCKSTNITKISSLSRGSSIMMFGVFSKKINKQWHCNNCKSDF